MNMSTGLRWRVTLSEPPPGAPTVAPTPAPARHPTPSRTPTPVSFRTPTPFEELPSEVLNEMQRCISTKNRKGMMALMEQRLKEPLVDQHERPMPTIGFVFSIEGVLGLMHEGKVFDGVIDALRSLQISKIPFVFFTNAGGLSEKKFLAMLEQSTGLRFEEHQLIHSHTPFRDLARQYKDQTILVVGGLKHTVRDIAKEYGFKNVVTSSDVYRFRSQDHELNYHEPSAAYHRAYGYRNNHLPLTEGVRLKIDAILVFGNSYDWGFDLQLIVDLLLSEKGYYGTVSKLNGKSREVNNGYLQDSQPPIFFSSQNATVHDESDNPRLGQGAFEAALDAVWNVQTHGADLSNRIQFGTPAQEAFSFAERSLQKHHRASHKKDSPNMHIPPIQTVYMVGDNPATDIAGTNVFVSQYHWNWRSILVETGLYQRGTKPSHIPNKIVPNLQKAIEWAREQVLRPLEMPLQSSHIPVGLERRFSEHIEARSQGFPVSTLPEESILRPLQVPSQTSSFPHILNPGTFSASSEDSDGTSSEPLSPNSPCSEEGSPVEVRQGVLIFTRKAKYAQNVRDNLKRGHGKTPTIVQPTIQPVASQGASFEMSPEMPKPPPTTNFLRRLTIDKYAKATHPQAPDISRRRQSVPQPFPPLRTSRGRPSVTRTETSGPSIMMPEPQRPHTAPCIHSPRFVRAHK
jgi:HAD superfamily hydrolase (TIGR01456 family)